MRPDEFDEQTINTCPIASLSLSSRLLDSKVVCVVLFAPKDIIIRQIVIQETEKIFIMSCSP